jgi:hypothetical protein
LIWRGCAAGQNQPDQAQRELKTKPAKRFKIHEVEEESPDEQSPAGMQNDSAPPLFLDRID